MKKSQIFLLAACLGLSAIAQGQGYSFQVVSVPDSVDTNTGGMNNVGDIVGNFTPSLGGTSQGFVYRAGGYSDVYFPGSHYTVPEGINSDGTITGFYQLQGAYHGFLYSGGSYSTFDYPGGATTLLFNINNLGDLIGVSDAALGAFLYSNGVFTPIAYPGGSNTGVLGINDSIDIVGYYAGSDGRTHGYLKSGDQYTTIDYPAGAQGTILVGVNNHGQILGYYYDSGFINHAFLYENGVFTQVPLPSLTVAYVTGFNDSAQFVGFYAPAQGQIGFLATPR